MMLHKGLQLRDVQLKFDAAKTGVFSGYACVFGGLDVYNDTIQPGAFAKTLKDRTYPVKMFFNHQSFDLPIGRWPVLKEDDIGLFVEGEMTPGNLQAENVLASLKHETIDGLSIGFRLSRDDFELVGDGERRLIKNITELVEISVVNFPADEAARVDLDSVKMAIEEIETIRDFERVLRDAGHFSKGAAQALITRARDIFQRDAGNSTDAKAAKEIRELFDRFKLPTIGDHHASTSN